MKSCLNMLIILLTSFIFTACGEMDLVDDPVIEQENSVELESAAEDDDVEIDAGGSYTSPEDVSLYIYTFDKLPENFITKAEARDLGWEASEGNLWDVTDEKSIGGDRFGNREGLLPFEAGREYFEADVNYHGGYRGAERIVYSNDGLIYYTEDHYDSFTLLYGE